jgi:uncharacterized protein (DUF111 family)
MLLGALLDAGADLERLRSVPDVLSLPGIEITVERVERQGIGALHLQINAPDDRADRSYREIRTLVGEAGLAPKARTQSLPAFARLA